MESRTKIIASAIGAFATIIGLWNLFGFWQPASKRGLEDLTKAYITTTLCNDNASECALSEIEKDRLKRTMQKLEGRE